MSALGRLYTTEEHCIIEQGVALTGRNRTGPPCSVGRPTVHAPGGRPARPPAALQTTDASEQNYTGPLGEDAVPSGYSCDAVVTRDAGSDFHYKYKLLT